MRTSVIILLIFLMSGCVSTDEWTKGDTRAEIAWQVMNVIDGKQTMDIQNHPNLVEGDPLSRSLLGPNPSTQDTIMIFATYGISLRANHENGLR